VAEELGAWLGGELARRGLEPPGEIACVHERPWSRVWRAETPGGAVFVKEAGRGGRHEPALVAALAPRFPDLVAAPLAIEPARGWLALPDLGRKLRDALGTGDRFAPWYELLPRYAELQLATSSDAARWLGCGVPDRRVERLAEIADALLADDAALCVGEPGELTQGERAAARALLPELAARSRELAGAPFAAALDHGDLHDGNVLVRDGARRLADWGDACVTHPFVSLLIPLRTLLDDDAAVADDPRALRLWDAYLEPFAAQVPLRELRSQRRVALWLGHLARALDWHHMLAGVERGARSEWQPQVAGWLRRWLERGDLLAPSSGRP
jgi:hypothetical protein